MVINVMLVDDHSIVRQGIKAVISQVSDIRVIAEAANGKEAVKLAKKNNPDVIVMDITLPFLNGLEASRKIMKENKNIKILILSMHENRAFIEKALSLGIRGYLLKDSAADEVTKAVKDVYYGKYFLSSKISNFVIQDYVQSKKNKILKSASTLTNREREVLQLIAEGLSNKQIAKELKITLKTTFVHRNNIMRKLNIHNQAQLIRFALKEGISSL